MIISGNTSGSITSVPLDITGTLTAFALYNMSGGAIVATVGVVLSGTERYLFNYNLAIVDTANSSAYEETKLTITAGSQIFLIVTGSCNYFMQID